jgi:hypothetical protein
MESAWYLGMASDCEGLSTGMLSEECGEKSLDAPQQGFAHCRRGLRRDFEPEVPV